MSLDISGSSAQDINDVNDAPLRELSTNLTRLSVGEEADVNSKWRTALSPVYEESDYAGPDDGRRPIKSRVTASPTKANKSRTKASGQKLACNTAAPSFFSSHHSTIKATSTSPQPPLSPGSMAKQTFLRRLEQRGLAYTEPRHLPLVD